MSTAEKEFVLTHVFKDVSSMTGDKYYYSLTEEHFGVPWCVEVSRNGPYFTIALLCEHNQEKKRSIETWFEGKLTAVNGRTHSRSGEFIFDYLIWQGWHDFIHWEDMMKNYVVDDTLKVECHVKIKKMTGIVENPMKLEKEKKNLREFDESTKEFSDVVLVVENQKFYVLKLYLALQSPYFKAMFLQGFEESKKSEITLKDINAKDFQNFLELLYGENSIDESTVEGIVHLAAMYDANLAIRKSEEFLMEQSTKSLKEKLELAHRYNLKNLKVFGLQNRYE